MKTYTPLVFSAVVFLSVMSYRYAPYLFPHQLSKNIVATTTDIRSKLSKEAYYVMYQAGTEAPFSSPLNDEHRMGTFVSADSGLPLFRSEDKFDSGTGWPSFTKPISQESVILREDELLGIKRTEVLTTDTHAHLGHVFDDGPPPLGKRWCMNGVALRFIPDENK